MNLRGGLPIIPQASQPAEPLELQPTLAWPTLNELCVNADLSCFPEDWAARIRLERGLFAAWSEDFMEAIERSRDQIWLIDSYLLATNEQGQSFVDVFECAFLRTSARRVYLLTAPNKENMDQYERLKKLERIRQEPPQYEDFVIDLRIIHDRQGTAGLPHDRFAVLDDELWHWGANVGGTHNQVNAYSRGWSANQTNAIPFFKQIWRCGGKLRP